MKCSVESINKVQFRIQVDLDKNDTQSAFDKAYQRLKGTANIRGFRKGKAPIHLLKKLYKENVAADVADRLIKDHLFDAIENEKITPISQPVLETAELPVEGEEYTFSALVDVMPEIVVDGYKGLAISYQEPKIGDDSVAEELENLRRRLAKVQDAADGSAAADGDIVTIQQTAALDGTALEQLAAKDAPIELGQKAVHEAIEQGLIGMKVGESKDVKVPVPEEAEDKALAGKTLDVNLTVSKIQNRILPELGAEFAKDLGAETVDELKGKILEAQKKQAAGYKRDQLETAILQQLDQKHDFDVPPSIVDRVIDSLIAERYRGDAAKVDEARRNAAEREEAKGLAKQKAKNSLMLHEIIKKEQLEITDADLDQFCKEQELTDDQAQEWKARVSEQEKENLLYRKAMDMLIESSQVSVSP